MKKTSQRGFTLIELLVVIAIIGILASVILASLNSARAKGTDAATKADLSNARAQAELFYDSNGNTYAGVCAAGAGSINTMVADVASKTGTILDATPGGTASPTVTACHDSAAGWAAAGPLKSVANSYFCVDSTGSSKVTTGGLSGGAVVCS